MIEEFVLDAIRYILVAFSLIGVVFHLVVLKSPNTAKNIEAKLATELGTKKRFVSWLEKSNMDLHERLINSKSYNVVALLFLGVLIVFLIRS